MDQKVSFKVNLASTPKGHAKGTYECEIQKNGILLTKGKKKRIEIPVGSDSQYLSKNQLSVALPEYEIEISIAKLSMYQEKFARDLVKFLDGNIPQLQTSDYTVPWYLFALSVLPVGIPIITLGGAIPGMIGFGLMAACFGVAQQEKMSMLLRILIILGIIFGGYSLFIGIAFTTLM